MSNPFQNIIDSEIGEGTTVGAYCEIYKAKIGKNCSIQAFCYICPTTVIEDDVFIGPGTITLNDKYPPSHGKHWAPVIIKKGASIGGGCVLLPGVTIGEGAMIGAGSVVTKSVPKKEVWYGNPAKNHSIL
jgi:acetyltransferase-like isoleucine patch superfamily enzyme